MEQDTMMVQDSPAIEPEAAEVVAVDTAEPKPAMVKVRGKRVEQVQSVTRKVMGETYSKDTVEVTYTRSTIEEALRGVKPGRGGSYYVRVNGVRYSPYQALAAATPAGYRKHLKGVVTTLQSLGYDVREVETRKIATCA